MLVFIDETGTDRKDAMRRCGYSLRGQPAKTHKLLVGENHITAIVAICVEGVLACKIVEENVTGEVFEDFLYTCNCLHLTEKMLSQWLLSWTMHPFIMLTGFVVTFSS